MLLALYSSSYHKYKIKKQLLNTFLLETIFHINVIPDQSRNISFIIALMRATCAVGAAERTAWGEVSLDSLTPRAMLRGHVCLVLLVCVLM